MCVCDLRAGYTEWCCNRSKGHLEKLGGGREGRFQKKNREGIADSHRPLLGARMDVMCRLSGDSTPVGAGGWDEEGPQPGDGCWGVPMPPQTPGTTSVNSAPGLSAPAATWSSTGASTLERSRCSECGVLEEGPGRTLRQLG